MPHQYHANIKLTTKQQSNFSLSTKLNTYIYKYI